MKEPELQEWACRLLEDQLMRLAELRNANPRDPGFKLWRQTTLTVIQRVWPGNIPRSERFRRVPFTPPSARPTRVQVREHFERGCSEATAYLRELIQDIQNGALDPSRAAAELAEPPPSAPSAPSIAASLAAPLPGEIDAPPPPPPAPIRPAKGAPPPPIVGFQSSSLSAATDSEPAPSQSSRSTSAGPPAPPAPPGAGGVKRPSGRGAKPPRKSERRALKEMLGFMDEPQAATPRPGEEESLEPEPPDASFGQSPSVPQQPLFHEPNPLDGADSPPEDESLPLVDEDDIRPLPGLTHASISAEQVEQLDDEDEPTMGEDPAEMLRSSWASAHPETSVPATSGPQTGLRSPVAAALQALASEVADLGVPEGKRAAARAALTDLARQIEERSADWETLRDAFALAMDYPPLARRVVPLLVPFLDLE